MPVHWIRRMLNLTRDVQRRVMRIARALHNSNSINALTFQSRSALPRSQDGVRKSREILAAIKLQLTPQKLIRAANEKKKGKGRGKPESTTVRVLNMLARTRRTRPPRYSLILFPLILPPSGPRDYSNDGTRVVPRDTRHSTLQLKNTAGSVHVTMAVNWRPVEGDCLPLPPPPLAASPHPPSSRNARAPLDARTAIFLWRPVVMSLMAYVCASLPLPPPPLARACGGTAS